MDLLGIVTLLVILAVIGFALWIITTYVPMPEPYKRALIVIAVLALLLWVARVFIVGAPVLRVP